MGAGASAEWAARRSLREADEHERRAQQARAEAQRYLLASRTEATVASRLGALDTLGWRVLADRRWAGSKNANVDLLLVGPGGVVVADVKAWRALQVRDGSLFCDAECRDGEADKLLALAGRVQDCVGLLGMSAQAVHPLLVFAGRDVSTRAGSVHLVGDAGVAAWVARLGLRLDPGQVEQVATVLGQDFPPYDAPPPKRVRVPRLPVVMPRRERASRIGVSSSFDPALFDVEELAGSLLAARLAEPIESWMTFLHPDQHKLVQAGYSGPARVRGPAGTGKTVVGLHRAVHLAQRRPERVLFVTYVKTLPRVLEALCERMSPAARANIDFRHLHGLAIEILDRAGIRCRIDGARATRAFDDAWAASGRDSALTRLDARPSYWREELDHVIKGRGLDDFEQYAELSRVGRRTPMRLEHRQAMWQLYVAYQDRLRDQGVHDFTDALLVARDLVRRGEVSPAYGTVVADEVQDLNLVGVQLLHAIAGDGPDGLLVIGDGQQSVYPGGFTLREAGISVTGRATVLRTNYRNTVEILETAARVVAHDSFDDLEDEPSRGERDVEAHRHGYPPTVVRAPRRRDLDAAMLAMITDTRDLLGVPLGDVAVLVATRAELARYLGLLAQAGVPCLDLQDYDGISSDRVKVGTFKRAKGLEFKYVLLPGLAEGAPPRRAGECDDSHRERAERLRRELYVGMTRARDGLWLGYLTT